MAVLFHEDNIQTVAKLLLDSLKQDSFVPEGTTPEEFIDGTEAGVLVQLVQGFAKANKKVLPGPLRKRLAVAWDKMLTKVDEQTTETDKGDEFRSDAGRALADRLKGLAAKQREEKRKRSGSGDDSSAPDPRRHRPVDLESASGDDWENLELTIVDLVGYGFSEDFVLNMDVESFDILVERVLVVRFSAKIESLWSNFAASQADKKSVKALAKELDPRKAIAKGRLERDGRSRRS